MYIRHLKNILSIIIGTLILCSCNKHDTSCVITGIRIYPVTSETYNKKQIKEGWYFSKFQDFVPMFLITTFVDIDYEILGLTDYNSFYWANYPIDSSLIIYTDRQLILDHDTIEGNQNIVKYFNVRKKEIGSNYRSIYYELNLKDSISLITNNSYYTFFCKLDMNDGAVFRDSCLICFK